MTAFIGQYYDWFKAFHVLAIICWMAGMLYLPRLYVYHAECEPGSDKSETFKIMEKRLFKIIMNPAMIAAWIFGILMIAAIPDIFSQGWMHVKFTCVIAMSAIHGIFSKWRKVFEADKNEKPAKFYRIWNEVPAVLMVIIVIMAVAEPF